MLACEIWSLKKGSGHSVNVGYWTSFTENVVAWKSEVIAVLQRNFVYFAHNAVCPFSVDWKFRQLVPSIRC